MSSSEDYLDKPKQVFQDDGADASTVAESVRPGSQRGASQRQSQQAGGRGAYGTMIANEIRTSADQFAQGIEQGYGAVAQRANSVQQGTGVGGLQKADSKATHTDFDESDASQTGGFTSDFYNAHPKADISDSSSEGAADAQYQPQKSPAIRECGRICVFLTLMACLLAPCICLTSGVIMFCQHGSKQQEGSTGKDWYRIGSIILICLGSILTVVYCVVCCFRRGQDEVLVDQDEDEYEEETAKPVEAKV